MQGQEQASILRINDSLASGDYSSALAEASNAYRRQTDSRNDELAEFYARQMESIRQARDSGTQIAVTPEGVGEAINQHLQRADNARSTGFQRMAEVRDRINQRVEEQRGRGEPEETQSQISTASEAPPNLNERGRPAAEIEQESQESEES